MKLLAVAVALVASLVTIIEAQGWWQFNPFFGGQSPPGLQFNPAFNGQNQNPNPPGSYFNSILNGYNPNPNVPSRNFSNYPPFIPPFFGGQSPPGLQFNPVFNGQNQNPNPPGSYFNPIFNGYNPNPNVPSRNFSNYPPFITNFPQRNNSNFQFWSGPFYPFLTRQGRRKRAADGRQYYSPYYCIPDHQQCNGSHSLSIGCLSPWDKALFRQSYVKPGKLFWKREKLIDYPGDFLPPGFVRNETITAIKIQDRNCNGTGGYAEVMPGTGIGYRRVRIRMYSTGARKGFNFYVQIFGK